MNFGNLPEGYDTDFKGDTKEEMVKQLQEVIEGVQKGEVTAVMLCGVCSDGDIFGGGVCPDHTNLSKLHDAIMQMHETFHDCVDQASEEERAAKLLKLLAGAVPDEGEDDDRKH